MAQNNVELFTVEIDVNAAVADMAKAQANVDRLKKAISELDKTQAGAELALAEYSAELKNAQVVLREQTKLTQAHLKLEEEELSTLDRLQAENAILRKERNALNLETAEGRARLIELNAALDINNAKIKENSDKQKQQALNVGNYKESIKEAIQETGLFNTQLLKLAKNPIVLIILGIVAALKLMFDGFKKSETGAKQYEMVLAKLTAVFETIEAAAGRLAVWLVKMFEDPIPSLKELGQLILDNLYNRLIGIAEFIPKLGEALVSVFSGDFEKAATTAGNALMKIMTGVDDFYRKLGETFSAITIAMQASARAAETLKNAQTNLQKTANAYKISIASQNKEAEKQNAIANDTTQSFKDRREALMKYQTLSESVLKKQETLAEKELAIVNLQIAQNAVLKRDNRALYNQRAELTAAQTDAETALMLKQMENKRVLAELNRDEFETNLDYLIDNFDRFKTYNEKQISDTNKAYSERLALIQATRELSNTAFTEQIAEIQTRTDAQIDANDLLMESDTRVLLEKVRNLNLDEIESKRLLEVLRERSAVLGDLAQTETEIKIESIEKLAEFQKSEQMRELEAAKQTAFTKIEIERLRLAEQQEIEIATAQKIGADTSAINARYRKANAELDKTAFNAKLELASGFSANLATIFGEQTAVGKAAAIAETTINTYKSATGAYSALAPIPVVGPVLGAAAAGAAIAAGFANVRKILSVDSGLPGDNSVRASTPSGGSSSNITPSVNQGIVSRETFQNQTEQMNVQPTLVIDDVQRAQRNSERINRTSVI